MEISNDIRFYSSSNIFVGIWPISSLNCFSNAIHQPSHNCILFRHHFCSILQNRKMLFSHLLSVSINWIWQKFDNYINQWTKWSKAKTSKKVKKALIKSYLSLRSRSTWRHKPFVNTYKIDILGDFYDFYLKWKSNILLYENDRIFCAA